MSGAYCADCGTYHGRLDRCHKPGWCYCGAVYIHRAGAVIPHDGVRHGIHRCVPEDNQSDFWDGTPPLGGDDTDGK